MMSSYGNIFRVTGPLCEEFTGHRWIPPHKGQWRETLMFSLICAWINGWVNNRNADDLRRHRGHYNVTVMKSTAKRLYRHALSQCGFLAEVDAAIVSTELIQPGVLSFQTVPRKRRALIFNKNPTLCVSYNGKAYSDFIAVVCISYDIYLFHAFWTHSKT